MRACIVCERPEAAVSRLLSGPAALAICDRCTAWFQQTLTLDCSNAYRELAHDIGFVSRRTLWALIHTNRASESADRMCFTHTLWNQSSRRRIIAYRSPGGARILVTIDSYVYPRVLPASVAMIEDARLHATERPALVARPGYDKNPAFYADLERQVCSFCGAPGRVPWTTVGGDEHAHICCPCVLLAYDIFERDGPMPTVVIRHSGRWNGTNLDQRRDDREDR